MTKMRNAIGPLVFWFERLRWYLVLAQGLMVYQLWAKTNLQDYSGWTIILYLVIASAVILVFDALVVYPGFAKKTSTINPEWVELREDVKAIQKSLANMPALPCRRKRAGGDAAPDGKCC